MTEQTSPKANPLLQPHTLPPFNAIKAEHVLPAVEQLIRESREFIEDSISDTSSVSWNSFAAPLEQQGDQLEQAFSPVSHLNAVVNTDEMRDAYNQAVVKLTEYGTWVGQNSGLFNAYKAISERADFNQLSTAQQKACDNALRDFHLAGVDLPEAQKQRFGEIQKRLAELSTGFSNNVLDATMAWHKQITDQADLAGLPESAIGAAKQAAEQKELDGWVFTLDFPSYLAVMTHADSETLRKEMYTAFNTKASTEGQKADGASAAEWNNSELINETLALRHELAQLLGFDSFADRSMATKMADSPQQVLGFLNELAEKSKPVAEQDLNELKQFAQDHYGKADLNAWDLPYYSEKLRVEVYAISQEMLKPYFPADTVIGGMFEVVKRLFNIDIQAAQTETYHPDVRYYEISRDGEQIASFYLDLCAREHKRGGAWMADCRVKRQTETGLQKPVAFLTCNFSAPIGDQPALLTHDEVTTLFHEFGHGLHHMLTQIDVAAVSGINGVAWDAVELPSQFLENWCFEEEVLELISGHFETGEKLPKDLLDKMLAAKNFQAGMFMMRQLEFAIFDLRLHAEYNPENPREVQSLLDEVRQQVAVIIPPSFNKFQNSFSHIFAGGYAAGYYSYKWAEVLSADAFSRFEEEGIFNKDTGESFLHEILEQGGSKEPMELFTSFRGRKPSVEPLLRHCGITQ